VRRYGLVLYWLAFAVYTLDAARNPGLLLPGAPAPYPWRGVLATWLALAVLTGGLHAILRPRTFHRSWARLAWALAYSIVLLAASFVTFVTDLPGFFYVPGMFALITPLALLLLSATLAFRPRQGEAVARGPHAPAP
jgi:hypothetical protein